MTKGDALKALRAAEDAINAVYGVSDGILIEMISIYHDGVGVLDIGRDQQDVVTRLAADVGSRVWRVPYDDGELYEAQVGSMMVSCVGKKIGKAE